MVSNKKIASYVIAAGTGGVIGHYEGTMMGLYISLLLIAFGVALYLYDLRVNKMPTVVIHERTLDDADKTKIVNLITTVHMIEDKLHAYCDEALNANTIRESNSQFNSMVNSDEFNVLWKRFSNQSAQVTVISPKLSELSRHLLMAIKTHYHYLIQPVHASEYELRADTQRDQDTIMNFKKLITAELCKLTGVQYEL